MVEDDEIEKIKEILLKELDGLKSEQAKLSLEQNIRFSTYVNTIFMLTAFDVTKRRADATLKGNCGENAMKSALELLRWGQENGYIIRFQKVSALGADNDSHGFIWLHGSGKEHNIKGKKQTEKFLKDMKGKLCDSWNGEYIDASKTKNLMFKKFWDSLNITSEISLDFDYSGFTKPLINFLNNQLKKIGFRNMHGSPEYRFSSTEVTCDESRRVCSP
jgi:hypothetical protein